LRGDLKLKLREPYVLWVSKYIREGVRFRVVNKMSCTFALKSNPWLMHQNEAGSIKHPVFREVLRGDFMAKTLGFIAFKVHKRIGTFRFFGFQSI
jgi:hypothetical protein